jgi:pimeloyl-ACP methyl ester carboxylesterase
VRGWLFGLGPALVVALGIACGSEASEPTRPAPVGDAATAFRAKVRHARLSDGTRIAWYERGAGPPLVMATGTGSTMAEWDPALLRLLARHRRLILFDYPGIGRSSPLRGRRTSFAALADDVARFMVAIGVPQADVLGWSMGGFVAQQLAIRHPERLRRMVLAGTNPGGDLAVLGPPAAQEIDSDPGRSDEAALRVLYPQTRGGQAEGRRFRRRLERSSETGEIPDDFRVPDATVRAQVEAEDPWLRSNANSRALRRVAIPTLATGGTLDPVTPPVNMRRVARLIPGARLELFAGGAHAFLFQFRDRFAASVDRFLGG